MKADFEKGTKVCCKCGCELPLSEFSNNCNKSDGKNCWCKQCYRKYKIEYKKTDRYKEWVKRHNNKRICTFGRCGVKRGNNGIFKRDYEITDEQLKRREFRRRIHKSKPNPQYGILIWYDGSLDNVSSQEYSRVMHKEYQRQFTCAVRGYVARAKQSSEHFLFDFDLEKMLECGAYYGRGRYKYYITKWWDGEIRHWTVNDEIWRK